MTVKQLPPRAILAAAERIMHSDATWQKLTGGRTNTAWRAVDSRSDLVFKLYASDRTNTVFANDPHAELAVLSHLREAGVALEPVELIEAGGQSCLVYHYVTGNRFEVAHPSMASTLRAVHETSLQQKPSPLCEMPDGLIGAALRLMPEIDVESRHLVVPDFHCACRAGYLENQVLLHGDPTPANAVATPNGACFLDWQCPRFGDPVDDLAVLVSPAMHVVYGARPLNSDERRAVLEAYGDTATLDRFEALERELSRAIALYCQWKLDNGESIYARARDAEMTFLSSRS